MYNKLLLVINPNDLDKAEVVVENALRLTAGNPDAVFRVMSVIEPPDGSFVSSFLPPNFDKAVIAEADKRLHEFTRKHFPDLSKVQHIVAHGTIYEEVIHIVEERNVDLVLMLANGKRRGRGLGPKEVHTVRGLKIPVFILR